MNRRRVLGLVVGTAIFIILISLTGLFVRPIYVRLEAKITETERMLSRALTDATGLSLSYRSLSPSLFSNVSIRGIEISDVASKRKIASIRKAVMEYDVEKLFSADPLSAFESLTVSGISVEYDRALAAGTLCPYAGFDFRYLCADDDAFNGGKDRTDVQFEGGLGIAYYRRGKDFKYNNATLDSWGRQFPVGVSLGVNSDQNGIANLVFSVYEKPDAGALIPNLGGFLEFEMVNMFRTGDRDEKGAAAEGKDWKKDSAFFLAGQLEYQLGVPAGGNKTVGVKPYLFGRLIQQRDSDGYLTREYDLDTRIGAIVNPCAMFSIDVRYERADVIWDLEGKDNLRDKGCLTCRFDVRL